MTEYMCKYEKNKAPCQTYWMYPNVFKPPCQISADKICLVRPSES